MPTTPTDKLMDAAYDHNVATRFGRMDVALDHVVSAARDDWARRHAAWGARVRIVDLELAGMQMRSRDEADVRVRVSWQHVDESDLRTTEIAQKWRSGRAGWQLDKEDCASGDDALLELPKDADAALAKVKPETAKGGATPRF